MTEHDTPSTAHTEALRRSLARNSGLANHRERDAFVEGAEWALVQVREELKALPQLQLKVGSSWMGGAWIVNRDAALAVVDRLEGKQ